MSNPVPAKVPQRDPVLVLSELEEMLDRAIQDDIDLLVQQHGDIINRYLNEPREAIDALSHANIHTRSLAGQVLALSGYVEDSLPARVCSVLLQDNPVELTGFLCTILRACALRQIPFDYRAELLAGLDNDQEDSRARVYLYNTLRFIIHFQTLLSSTGRINSISFPADITVLDDIDWGWLEGQRQG